MGKASRLKRERRAASLDEILSGVLNRTGPSPRPRFDNHLNPDARSGTAAEMVPAKVFKFFKVEAYADALASGKVHLSTLEICRAYEDPQQGDAEEGFQTYRTGAISGGGDDPAFVLMAGRGGVHIGPGVQNVHIGEIHMTHQLEDAYVICTTEHFDPANLGETFGRYCVQIDSPLEFFALVSAAIKKSFGIRGGGQAMRVIYRPREYRNLEPPPGPIGFVKPRDPYASQQEFRFLWQTVAPGLLTPTTLDVPQVAFLCKRLA